jgi:acyl carrier protein
MDTELGNKINQIIKLVMEIDVSSMNSSTKLNTISEWDSFNNLMLISKLQDEFKIEFTAVEIEEAQTIEAIFNLIEKKITK